MATPVFGSNHQIVGCMTILQDHSPIADLIDRIHYEERSLKIILDNLDVGIFTVDKGGRITFFNTAAEKISGFNRREILGQPCSAAEKISGFNRREILGQPCSAIFGGNETQEVCSMQDTVVDGQSRSSRLGKMMTRDEVPIPIRANYMALQNDDAGRGAHSHSGQLHGASK